MAPGSRPVSPRFPFATPYKRGRMAIPATGSRFQPFNNLFWTRRALAGQCPTNDNALDGFRHVEPAPSNGRVKRHDPVLHQPADQHRRLMTLQIVKHQQHAERGQGVEQLELDAETFLPLLPGQTELVRRHHGCLRETV